MKLKSVGYLFLEFLIGALLFLGSTSVYAQEAGDRWIYIIKSDDGIRAYVESTYKELSNGNKIIWEKYVTSDGTKNLSLAEYDCGKGKTRALQTVIYDRRGKVTDSESFSYAEWENPVPDSVGEALFDAVCRGKKQDTPPEQPSEHRPSETRPPPLRQPQQLPIGELLAQEEVSEHRAPKAEYRAPKTRKSASERNDIGVDYAIVTAERGYLRKNADLSSTVLLEVPKGDLLVLLNTAPDGSWHNVLHVKTNQEGWIHRNAVAAYYTKNPKPKLTIPGRDTGSLKNPSLEVKNDSNKELTLKIGETRYVFYSQETKTIQITPGKYSFYASAPSVIPDFGEENFQAGYVYTWRFYIVTTRR